MKWLSKMLLPFMILNIMISPGFGQDHASKAGKLFFMKDYQGAIKEYKLVLKANPNDARSYYNIGACYEMLGDLKNAKQAYQNALKVNPDFKEAKQALGNAENNAEFVDDNKISKSLVNANTAYLQKKYSIAITEFLKVIKIDPNHFQAHYNLAACYEQTKNYSQALSYFQAAGKLDQNSVEAEQAIARVRKLSNNRRIALYKQQLDSLIDNNHLTLAQRKARRILALSPRDNWTLKKMNVILMRFQERSRLEKANQAAQEIEAPATVDDTIDSTKKQDVKPVIAETVQPVESQEKAAEMSIPGYFLVLILGGFAIIIFLISGLLFRRSRAAVNEMPQPTKVPPAPKSSPVTPETLTQKNVYETIQTFFRQKKTGVLRIKGKKSDGKNIEGEVRMFSGNIVDCNSNDLQSEAALYQLLEVQKSVQLSFQNIQVTDSGNIQKATLPLLMQWTLGMKRES